MTQGGFLGETKELVGKAKERVTKNVKTFAKKGFCFSFERSNYNVFFSDKVNNLYIYN